jgi:hypothetical protein
MEIAFGVIKISPDDFWNMGLMEWHAAVRGYNKANGVKEASQPRPFDDAFVAAHNAQFKARAK